MSAADLWKHVPLPRGCDACGAKGDGWSTQGRGAGVVDLCHACVAKLHASILSRSPALDALPMPGAFVEYLAQLAREAMAAGGAPDVLRERMRQAATIYAIALDLARTAAEDRDRLIEQLKRGQAL